MTTLNRTILNSINEPQEKIKNLENLVKLGGIDSFVHTYIGALDENYTENGLNDIKVEYYRNLFGDNIFPDTKIESFLKIFCDALRDPILLILIAASIVSLIVGLIEEPERGWTEGVAISIAVLLVSLISAGNDYSKQLQFRQLEKTTANDELASVLRCGKISRINPKYIVIGDIMVMQAGDMIPADSIILDNNVTITSNESSLTGEAQDVKKKKDTDCFLLSSCLLNTIEGASTCRAVVIGTGKYSQWGKIKANLATNSVNTPLQDKLQNMTNMIGYIGMGVAFATFVALMISVWLRDGGDNIASGVIDAFIVAVTIIVVAIPEGLPLAVTISLSYSSKRMYSDNCLIRTLAACETMGNATNICTDKTGTLTENQMTVVEGWFANVRIETQEDLTTLVPQTVKDIITEQVSINRSAYLVVKDDNNKPVIVGSKTEGALLMLVREWGAVLTSPVVVTGADRLFPFDSSKKRSTAVSQLSDGKIRLYCKGASESVLTDCSMYLDSDGKTKVPLSVSKRFSLEQMMREMNLRARRTLCLAHKDFDSWDQLPVDWMAEPPDNSDLILDCIVAIEDPIRKDVYEAVATAIKAGITIRMVTGDNLETACAIAKRCGILTEGGVSLLGSEFRKMKPRDVDLILPKLQVLARSSPQDKYLLVTRLNGYGIPNNKEEWNVKMIQQGTSEYQWEADRDSVLPGYREEWKRSREGYTGEVVGVTGDGTNDAPALKAADVGMAMGLTGTKVAQGAADIVILDDKFSSIITAISWGRCVFDNIRKFLQFQLTVNFVALSVVFLSAVTGQGQPLNAVQLLWTNLVMDTMGALALATERPTAELLLRKPYKRSASLISYPMWRNILCQYSFQLTLLMVLLYKGPDFFDVEQGSLVHNTIMFNAFIFCQIFNEYTSRILGDNLNPFHGVLQNRVFMTVSIFSMCCQIVLVEFGGSFVGTTSLDINQWIITVLLGAIGLPIGVLMRFIPIKEDENSFFHNMENIIEDNKPKKIIKLKKTAYEPLLDNDLISLENGIRI